MTNRCTTDARLRQIPHLQKPPLLEQLTAQRTATLSQGVLRYEEVWTHKRGSDPSARGVDRASLRGALEQRLQEGGSVMATGETFPPQGQHKQTVKDQRAVRPQQGAGLRI